MTNLVHSKCDLKRQTRSTVSSATDNSDDIVKGQKSLHAELNFRRKHAINFLLLSHIPSVCTIVSHRNFQFVYIGKNNKIKKLSAY
jgi:predicted site-specific integrase-resolvase